jgi:hypothetical protein
MQFGVSTGAVGGRGGGGGGGSAATANRLRSADGAPSENASAGLSTDSDQQLKYEEIISLLLAGGYFRARISTLDPFDKVRICSHPIPTSTYLIFTQGTLGGRRNGVVHSRRQRECRH